MHGKYSKATLLLLFGMPKGVILIQTTVYSGLIRTTHRLQMTASRNYK